MNLDEFNLLSQCKPNVNPDDPDYHIELFWYGFKTSMYNFYITYKIKYDHVHNWSLGLNVLKSDKKYDEIEKSIRDYMSHYAFELAKNPKSNYHDKILISNIKRWDKISEHYKFKNCDKYNKIILLFYIYNEIKQDNRVCEMDHNPIIQTIDYTHSTNNYDSLIHYAILTNKSKILENLRLIPGYNVVENIKRLYPELTIQDSNIKMNKLCLLIRRYSI